MQQRRRRGRAEIARHRPADAAGHRRGIEDIIALRLDRDRRRLAQADRPVILHRPAGQRPRPRPRRPRRRLKRGGKPVMRLMRLPRPLEPRKGRIRHGDRGIGPPGMLVIHRDALHRIRLRGVLGLRLRRGQQVRDRDQPLARPRDGGLEGARGDPVRPVIRPVARQRRQRPRRGQQRVHRLVKRADDQPRAAPLAVPAQDKVAQAVGRIAVVGRGLVRHLRDHHAMRPAGRAARPGHHATKARLRLLGARLRKPQPLRTIGVMPAVQRGQAPPRRRLPVKQPRRHPVGNSPVRVRGDDQPLDPGPDQHVGPEPAQPVHVALPGRAQAQAEFRPQRPHPVERPLRQRRRNQRRPVDRHPRDPDQPLGMQPQEPVDLRSGRMAEPVERDLRHLAGPAKARLLGQMRMRLADLDRAVDDAAVQPVQRDRIVGIAEIRMRVVHEVECFEFHRLPPPVALPG